MNKKTHILIFLVIALIPSISMFGLQKQIDSLKNQAARAVGSRKEQLLKAIANLEAQAQSKREPEKKEVPVRVEEPVREDRNERIRELLDEVSDLLIQIHKTVEGTEYEGAIASQFGAALRGQILK